MQYQLIQKSTRHILIENQYLYSTATTHNRIIQKALDQCILHKGLRLVVITNEEYNDMNDGFDPSHLLYCYLTCIKTYHMLYHMSLLGFSGYISTF